MDHKSRKRGQSLIEATLSLSILLLILTSALGVVATLKSELKHDFVTPDLERNPPPEITGIPFLSDAIKMLPSSQREALEHFESEGWQIKTQFRGAKIFLLVKNDEKMILTKLLGVNICTTKSN